MRKGALVPMAVAAVLFGAIGFGAGLVLGPEAETVVIEGAAAPEHADSERSAPDYVEPVPEEARTVRMKRSGARRARATSSGDPSLGSLLDSIPAPEHETGDGVITARVKTVEEAPVEGITVVLTPQKPPQEKAADPRPRDEIPIEELLRGYAERLVWERSGRREAVTDAEGLARFDLCADIQHMLRGKREGWNVHPLDWTVANDARPGAEVVFLATATAKVEASIALPDGTEPEHAKLEFKRSRAVNTHPWTPTKPFAWIAPGTYEVRAVGGSKDEFASPYATAKVEDGKAVAPLTLQLKGRPGIHGKVVFAEGGAPSNVRVYALAVPAGTDIDEVQLRNSGKQSWVSKGAGFAYNFQDLPPGRYAVGTTRSQNGTIAKMEFVEVPDGSVEHDLEIPPLARSEYLLVHAFGPDGETLRGFSVHTRFQGKRSNRSGGSTAMPQPDGSVRVMHQPAEAEAEGQHFVTVSSQEFGTLEEQYTKGPASEVTARFAHPATLKVTVTGHEGKRYAGMLHVYASRVVQEGKRTRWVGGGGGQIGAEGTHDFGALQPGEYRLTLSVGTRNRVNVAVQTIRVGSGDNSVSLTVPQLSSLTVLGVTSGNVYARSKGRDPYVSVRGIQGKDKWVLDFLPPGEYEIRASGKSRQTVTVPGTTEVQF